MILLLLEALAVLAIAIFIVWWTMFSGRGKPAETIVETAPPRIDNGPAAAEAAGTGAPAEEPRRGD